MLFTTQALSLVLALAPTTIFAAPTQTLPSIANLVDKRALSASAIKALTDGSCDMSQVTLPVAPTALPAPAPGLKLAHVAIGRGTQNYTCATSTKDSKPVAVGAIAKLYNATCSVVRAPAVVADITRLALSYTIPDNDAAKAMLSGHHEFNIAGAPYFSLKTEAHDFGEIVAKKNASSNAPADAAKGSNGLGSVAWLKLTQVSGTIKEVYRVRTAGGMAPETCEGVTTQSFQVEYAAEYWFYQ